MARPPIEQEMKRGGAPRQLMWASIRARVEFSQLEVQDDTLIHWDTVGSYVRALVKSGHVEVIAGPGERRDGHCAPWRYRLVLDVGRLAPQVARDGSATRPAPGVQAMWTAMRILRTFNRPLLLQACTEPRPSDATAKSYIARLAAAGYLRGREPERGIGVRPPTVFDLVRDTGPLAPAITRDRRVFDRNLLAPLEPVDK